MRKFGTRAILASGFVLVIFTAGFFHADSRAPEARKAAQKPLSLAPSLRAGADLEERIAPPAAGRDKASQGLLALTQTPD